MVDHVDDVGSENGEPKMLFRFFRELATTRIAGPKARNVYPRSTACTARRDILRRVRLRMSCAGVGSLIGSISEAVIVMPSPSELVGPRAAPDADKEHQQANQHDTEH